MVHSVSVVQTPSGDWEHLHWDRCTELHGGPLLKPIVPQLWGGSLSIAPVDARVPVAPACLVPPHARNPRSSTIPVACHPVCVPYAQAQPPS
jgi:hypothetical protein